jgi:hypothetical protein
MVVVIIIIIIIVVIIEVAILADRNVTQKEAAKLNTRVMYREKRIRNMKCMIIQVTIRATGIVTKGLKKNLKAIPGKLLIDSLQKTAVLGTSHVIRKVLQSES